jgi:hypothetical protein
MALDPNCRSTPTFTIAGTVSGLSHGATATLVLTPAGGVAETLPVSVNGSFSFASPIPFNTSYTVTLASLGTTAPCTLTNGSGTVSTSNVSNVTLTCTATPVSMTRVVQAGNTVPNLQASAGQNRAQIASLKNGSTLVQYGGGGTGWHFVMNANGITVNPQQTYRTDGGFNNRGVLINNGTAAVFATHSGASASVVDSSGAVIATITGSAFWEPNVCVIGTEAFMLTTQVDPVSHVLVGSASNGTVNTAVQSIPDYGYNYMETDSISCGQGSSMGSYGVIAKNNPNQGFIGISQYQVTPANVWNSVGSELHWAIPSSSTYVASEMAVADSNGVMTFAAIGPDGRRQAFYARFQLTASGIFALDAVPVPLDVSQTQESMTASVVSTCEDAAVGCATSNSFYIVLHQGGRAAAGQPTNHTQSIKLYSLDFSSGALNSLATYQDNNLTQLMSDFVPKQDDLSLSCDGNLYSAVTLDPGSGVYGLNVFKYPVNSNTCTP